MSESYKVFGRVATEPARNGPYPDELSLPPQEQPCAYFVRLFSSPRLVHERFVKVLRGGLFFFCTKGTKGNKGMHVFLLFLAESPATYTTPATLKAPRDQSLDRVHDVQGYKKYTEHERNDKTLADLVIYPREQERMAAVVYSYTARYQCTTSCL